MVDHNSVMAQRLRIMEGIAQAEGQAKRDEENGCLLLALAIGVPIYLAVSFVFSMATAGVGSLAGFVSWLAAESLLSPLFPAPGDGPVRFTLSIGTALLLLAGPPLYLSRLLRGTRLAVLRWVTTPLGLVMVPITVWACASQLIAPIVRLPS